MPQVTLMAHIFIAKVWKAIDHYRKHISNKQTVLTGDFNSNTVWEKKHRISPHFNVVKRLQEKGNSSSYHLHHKQIQEKEQHPTLLMGRHKDKPYQFDYCFVSADTAEKITSVEIGDYDCWMEYSDHTPIIVTFNDNLATEQVNSNCIKDVQIENFSLSNLNIEIIDPCEFPHAIRVLEPTQKLKYSFKFLSPFRNPNFQKLFSI